MKDSVRLGKIERVSIRSVWSNEERDFTPWIKENISLIADLIERDIEDVENEITVGSYSADLVGKIVGTGELIVIENQFGETNHDHLGKLLTYLSGKNAKIGIWIAEDFRPEHIATLDYLNENVKADGPSLFGIKIEIKKIGNSDPAPELVIVVKPNEYQREISQEILSEADRKRHKTRLEFFSKLIDKYKELNPNWHKVKAQPESWLAFTAGRPGFSFVWAFKMKNGWRFSIELSIDQRDQEENKRMLKELEKMRGEIEKELGFQVDFEELPERRACKIEYSKQTSGPITRLTEDELEELTKWGTENMTVFSRVMSQYIRKLES
jgi:hypothetical protein